MDYKFYKTININNSIINIYYLKSFKIKKSIRYFYSSKDNSLYFKLPYFCTLKEIDKIIIDNENKIIKLINNSKIKDNKDYLNYYLGNKLDIYQDLIYFNNKYYSKDNFYKENKDLIYNTLLKFFNEEKERLNITKKHNFLVKFNIKSYYGINYINKNTIILNGILIHYSEEIIKSVIDHELTHDLVKGHSNKFYNQLLIYCPNYYILDKKLKKGEVK